jgi:DHA2 family multidrug resistance protein
VGLVIRELTAKHPIVDLRVLKDRTFAAGTFLMTMLGFVLYASLMLLPIYLQTLLGYPALQAGLALSPRGIGALLMTPISGQLTNRMDPRKLLFIGIATGGYTMFRLSRLNLNAGYWDIFWPQIIQGAAMAFLFVPLMATSMSGIAKEKMGNATSIYNLMRNIGGSFGIATMTTFLARREQVHQSQLIAHITPMNTRTQTMFNGLQNWFRLHDSLSAADAARKSWGAIYLLVQQQSAMLSFVEAFWVMGIIFWAMAPLLLLLRNARDLHPHEPRGNGPAARQPQEVGRNKTVEPEPEPELVGAATLD